MTQPLPIHGAPEAIRRLRPDLFRDLAREPYSNVQVIGPLVSGVDWKAWGERSLAELREVVKR
jgi:hypothetical protein